MASLLDGTARLHRTAALLSRHIRLAWPIFAMILVLRKPGAVIDAEFWAEDGPVWYQEAYLNGWSSLLSPNSGYLQTTPRIVALIAQGLPLAFAPTLFAWVAIAIQALPSALLVSSRMDLAWPGRTSRVAFALLLVLLPNAAEVFANLTNTQWHLALLSFLLVVASRGASALTRATDLALMALGGLSGPFCLFLLPVAWWQAVETREKVAWAKAGILSACAVTQLCFLAATMGVTRSAAPLGASVSTLARIVANQVEIGGLIGAHFLALVTASTFWASSLGPICLASLGLAMVLVAFAEGRPVLRKALLAGAALLAAELIAPQVSLDQQQWGVLTLAGAGNRYFFIPIVLWIGVCFTLVHSAWRGARGLALGALCLLPLGIAGDWPQPDWRPSEFQHEAARFAHAAPGTAMQFQVQPPGFPPLTLIKR